LKPSDELVGDAVGILLDKLEAVVPGRPVHVPVLVVALVDAEQHTLLLLPEIGEAFEVDDQRQFAVERRDLGDRLGDEVVVFHRRDRQVDTRHEADLLGPQAAGIDDMLGLDGALLGDHLPGSVGPMLERDDPVVLDNVDAAHPGALA
jgi:hypothetical protein